MFSPGASAHGEGDMWHWPPWEWTIRRQLQSTEIVRPRSGHHLVEILSKIAELRQETRGPSLNLEGHWTPGHSDIFGNELVDGEAKWAAAGRSSATKVLPRALRKRLPLSAAARKQAYRKRADEVAGQMWSESPQI